MLVYNLIISITCATNICVSFRSKYVTEF